MNDDLQSQVIGGRYRIEGRIGSGGMATVYRGVDLESGQVVAIKLLRPEVTANDPGIVERFEREGQALRRLNHPNIVSILATIKEDNGETYVVLEYVEGGDLRSLIQDYRRRSEMMPVERILNIALDLADALSRAHRLKIIHRDIKPDNILLARDGTPRLTDFGVAHMDDASRVTQTGAIIGTLSYLSPEACTGDVVDQRADIWAFGVVLYEMLTLRLPFDESSTAAMLTAILAREPADLAALRPDTPPELIALVNEMLIKDRNLRLRSARLVGARIEAIISGDEAVVDDTDSDTEVLTTDVRSAVEGYRQSLESTETKHGASIDTGEFVPDHFSPESYPPITDRPSSRPDWTGLRGMTMNGPPRIFISYRRADSISVTGRIHDRMVAAFGAESVFKDVDDIPAGMNFKQVLQEEVNACNILLVIIGEKWANITDTNGMKRLNDPNDFVRIEVEAALKRGNDMLVIPVLVEGATMPAKTDLPESMHELVYRNAASIRNDPDFNRDVQWLTDQITKALAAQNTITSTPPRRNMPLLIGGVIGALILFALAAFLFSEIGGDDGTPDEDDLTPQEAGIIQVEPVAADEVMVLVANLEALSGTTRADPTRFILEDLQARLERDLPFSMIRMRAYPAVITSAAQANEIAQANEAELVLWGRYDDDGSEINLQVGTLDGYPPTPFNEAELRQIIDVTFALTDERQQSLATSVTVAVNIFILARGDVFSEGRGFLVLSELDAMESSHPEVLGTSVASRWNRAGLIFLSDPETALTILNQAIDLNASLPLLYIARSALLQIAGQYDASIDDINTAQALGPDDWAAPPALIAQQILLEGDVEGALPYYERQVELLPDDWYAQTFYGITLYLLGDYEGASIAVQRALQLNPQANFAHLFAAMLALRNGQLFIASQLIDQVLELFPNPNVASRMLSAVYQIESPIGEAASAFGNFTLRQWTNVIQDVERAVEMDEAFVNTYLPEIYMVSGIAHCNLGDYDAAEADYTRLIDLDPSFTLAYALRAQVRQQQGNARGVLADFAEILNSTNAREFVRYTRAFQDGDISCANFFDFDFSQYETTPEAP